MSKKSINSLKKSAETISDVDFRRQGSSMVAALVKVVNEAMNQGKVASKHFLNGVNKEIDVLSKMIDSPETKVDFIKKAYEIMQKGD